MFSNYASISLLCERHRVYLHKPGEYTLLHTKVTRYSPLLPGYKLVQQVTVLNTVGNCNTVVSTTCTLYYNNIIILWDHRRICGPSTETSSCGTWLMCYASVCVCVVRRCVGMCGVQGCRHMCYAGVDTYVDG
jgi:hypothetical protein